MRRGTEKFPSLPLTAYVDSRRNSNDIQIQRREVRSPPWLHENLPTSLTSRPIAERGCKIHGVHSLPPGYEFAYVPSDATFHTAHGRFNASIEIASSSSVIKSVITVAQTIYAAMTLYRTRGHQIELYGYAAFGLTVSKATKSPRHGLLVATAD